MRARISLHHVSAVLLALGLQACCGNDPDVTTSWQYEDPLGGELLDEIRMQNEAYDDRCEAACRVLAQRLDDVDLEEVESCSVSADTDPRNPWSEENETVTVICVGTTTGPGFCTGRRPQGHHEATAAVDSAGAWFATHAHLEAASVTAFSELAAWLERRGAPSSFAARCRAAADDEVVHSLMMGRLANLRGSKPERCVADEPSDDLLTVALHNAVEGCVHEAFAASIAAVQAERAHDPTVRATFARIAADERRHGQLAWDLHAWFLDQLDEGDVATVVKAQRRAFSQLVDSARLNAQNTPAELGWPTPLAAQVMARAFAQHVIH